ncbi:MAG: DUF4430 domain-containing protein [archaeon]|jgi:hypothetical protein
MQIKLHFVQIILIVLAIFMIFFAGQGTAVINNSCPQPIINNFIDVNVITPPITFDSNMFAQKDQNFSPSIIVNVESKETTPTNDSATTYVTNNYFQDNNEPEIHYDLTLKAFDENGVIILDATDSFVAGTQALDAMQELTVVEYTQYVFGVMILSIEGVSPGNQQYWALYQDGNYSSVGISEINIDNNTMLEWKIESW